jgi:hypothetical protein
VSLLCSVAAAMQSTRGCLPIHFAETSSTASCLASLPGEEEVGAGKMTATAVTICPRRLACMTADLCLGFGCRPVGS